MRLTWKPKFDCGYSMLFLLPGKSKFDCNKLFYPILGAKDYTRILLFSTTRRAVSCFYKQEQQVVEVYLSLENIIQTRTQGEGILNTVVYREALHLTLLSFLTKKLCLS